MKLVTDTARSIIGNRAYVLRLRKACTEALTNGVAAFVSVDQDDDETPPLITCSASLKVRALKAKGPIGFKA